jgi:hypothetical protein
MKNTLRFSGENIIQLAKSVIIAQSYWQADTFSHSTALFFVQNTEKSFPTVVLADNLLQEKSWSRCKDSISIIQVHYSYLITTNFLEHFCCKSCNKNLANMPFFEKDDHPICQQCLFKNVRQMMN